MPIKGHLSEAWPKTFPRRTGMTASLGRVVGVAFVTALWSLATPCNAGAQPAGKAKPSAWQKTAALLNESIDVKDWPTDMSLKQVLELIKRSLDAQGKSLPIVLNRDAFLNDDPSAPDIHETRVNTPPIVNKMTIGDFLRHCL